MGYGREGSVLLVCYIIGSSLLIRIDVIMDVRVRYTLLFDLFECYWFDYDLNRVRVYFLQRVAAR